jgi:hypothetical protein
LNLVSLILVVVSVPFKDLLRHLPVFNNCTVQHKCGIVTKYGE